MKKLHNYIIAMALLVSFCSCKKDWLERDPPNIIREEQVWNDPKMITGLLANYYDRLPEHAAIHNNWQAMAEYDDAMWSGFSNDNFRNNIVSYGFDRWGYWDYFLIRDINLALESIENVSTEIEAEQKTQFSAEFRFLRAYIYFEMVKRMGGVPLVTQQMIYDFSGDPSYLQLPRAKEAEVYDFIANEVDAIKDQLGNTGSKTRANKFTALALKSRAMLYAASIAKYNQLSGLNISTAGGEVGIPAARANEYYTKSLEASQEIIDNGGYSLYKGNPHLGENFYEAVSKKSNNTEVIWAEDFLVARDRRHGFTYDNIARSIREDNLASSAIAPSLNLVEDYEYLDGSSGELKTRTANNSDYIYYENPEDIFANKDWRLYGTIIYPGATFKGQEIEIQAGIKLWNAAGNSYQTIESDVLGECYCTPKYPNGDGGLLTGAAGPNRSADDVSNTGFYLRKYIDPAVGASTRGIRSDMWWVRFRLSEIYLNAAEAALELGNTTEALGYVNAVRERAGFAPNSLTVLTIQRLQNERRVELAFEDHRVWDLKRWRIAHQVWNGQPNSPDAVVYALYPYRVVRPGHPTHNKYVFDKLVAPRFQAPRFFQLGNYYSLIGNNLIDNNPKLVRNPFH